MADHPYSVAIIVATAVTIVIVGITQFRLHAFLTLLLAGAVVAVLSDGELLDHFVRYRTVPPPGSGAAKSVQWGEALLAASPLNRLTDAFGQTAGKIGILIALASLIGGMLAQSGAAMRIVDALLERCGPNRAPEAMATASFFLGIPVFFDTVFYLMIPMARGIHRRTKRQYVLLVLSILAGGSLAHSLVPPTPGPLFVAQAFNVDLTTMMGVGLIVAGVGGAFALVIARVIDRWTDIPMRAVGGDDAAEFGETQVDAPELSQGQRLRPTLLASVTPIVLPMVLLVLGSAAKVYVEERVDGGESMVRWLERFLWVGDKNVALAAGALACVPLMRYVNPERRSGLVTEAIASAGSIILITSAGGALGEMLRQAGVEWAIADATGSVGGLWILPLAFLVTASVRTVQGSATVAMITSAGVLSGFADAEILGFHPVYLAMAIGSGSKPVSWMTDSAFWVVTRMSGMTETEGLKTLAPMSTAMGSCGLAITLILAWCLPGAF